MIYARSFFIKATLGALSIFAAGSVLAQETLLGVHGGPEVSSTPGAISVIDQSNASYQIIANPVSGIGLTGIATDSNGRIFAASASRDFAQDGPHLIEINPATGGLLNDIGRLTTALGNDCYIGDLSFQPNTNTLFAVAGNQGDTPRCDQESSPGGLLVTINTSTAEVTVVGRDETLGNSNGGIAFAGDGTLFFTPCWSTSGVLLTIDPATADILTSTPIADGSCYMGLAVRPSDGTLFGSYDYINSPSSVLVTLDPQTGAKTLVGQMDTEIVHDLTFTDGLGVQTTGVPALSWQASLGLAALLLLMTSLVFRRLRNQ
jgi:DNA-binding beta-propeller fold protein YncE